MKHFPEHHEGVAGTQRDDYLLQLDDKATTHREAIRAAGFHAYRALISPRSAFAQEMADRIRNPRIGDLVVEWTTVFRSDPDTRLKSLGFLVAKREEWSTTEAAWTAAKAGGDGTTDADRYTETVWYVQYGPSPRDICRWVNCEFLAVITDVREFTTLKLHPSRRRQRIRA